VNVTKRELCEIPGMEEYKFYYADIDGNIYSHKHKKYKKLKTYPVSSTIPYRIVKLSNGNGKVKSFYVGRLIALAFLPNHTDSWGIRYKNKNITDNSLSNIEWVGRKTEKGLDTDTIVLNKEISDYIKLVHLSCIKKGIPVPDTYEFFESMIKDSLNEYISRFGLKKTMYQIENGLIG
jgi:hypothetical protein